MLYGPAFPRAMSEAWWMFDELQSSRGGSGFGPTPLSYSEIAAWSSLTRVRVRVWHLASIKALDAAYLSIMAQDVSTLDFSSLAEAD